MADESQFLGLYLAHEEGLRAFVRALVRDRSEFDDAFQMVVLTLWEKFDTYDKTRPFGPWARGVAAKDVFQVRRESGRRPTPFSPEVVEAILDSFERRLTSNPPESHQLEALEHCVGALPGRWRRLLDLRYTDGLSLAEMAGRIGRTLGATQRALSRVRQQLADCVKQRLLIIARGTL
jgi:RNA polymerase sigma-70 factor, ECF subfamily